MAKKFEIGKSYRPYQTEYDPITILRRTDKTIWCTNGQSQWRMKIRHDQDGNEFAIDSSVPLAWRDAFTYEA